jgi:two-component system, LytTR family, response regulator
MKCLIIDDEVKSQTLLLKLCKVYCPEIEVVGLAGSVDEGIKKIDLLKPDLVFLDIHMPVKSGFSLLDYYKDNIDFSVIFTTAYDEYALEAFRFSVTDYLQKPIDIEELQAAVKKAMLTQNINPSQISTLQESLLSEKVQKIALTTIEGFTFVKFKNIIRCEAQGNYTYVYLQAGKPVLITKTLKYYEELLQPKGFFRIHKSHLINLQEVRKFIKGKKSMVEMTDGEQIEVSNKKRERLLEKLSQKK